MNITRKALAGLWLGLTCSGLALSPLEGQEAESGYTRSLELIRVARLGHSQDPALLEVLAGAHYRWGRFREAIGVWEQVLKAQPIRIELNLVIGDAYSELEDYARAAESYARAVPSRDARTVALARRGVAKSCYSAGKYTETVAQLKPLVAAGEGGADLFLLLGRAIHAQAMEIQRAGVGSEASAEESLKLFAEAAAALERALQVDARNASALYLLASIYRRQGKAELAQKALETFRSVRPTTPALDPGIADRADALFEARTAVQLGRVFLAAGEHEKAMNMALHARRVDPALPDSVFLQASLHLQRGQASEAIKLYQELLGKQPENVDALWNLGKVYLQSEREAEGAELVLQAAMRRPGMAEAWELLTQLAVEKKAFSERAEELARNAVKARSSRENYFILADVLFSLGKTRECKEVLSEGSRRYPGDGEFAQALQGLAAGGN